MCLGGSKLMIKTNCSFCFIEMDEINLHDEIEEVAENPISTLGSMQIMGSNSFHRSIEFISRPNRNRNRSSSEVDIEDNMFNTANRPLPIFLKFEDVQYKVKKSVASPNPLKFVASQLSRTEPNYIQILKGMTGSVAPGEILALMGPSGSGKTTLLKIIGGRVRENVKGSITYNNIPYNPALKRRIGFVTQEDVLFPQLTVEETLVFAALLRLPNTTSKMQKYERVEMIIKELGLERCRHTKVGGGFVKGISGGERKRTSIGYEILVDPSLLLLDEPTSGLDSSSSYRLLQVLQGVAEAGRTIITTIHQPSSRVFYMFDKVLLISDGHPLYFGAGREAMDYFSSLRFIPEIAMNPADFLLDLATGQVNDISVPGDVAANRASLDYDKMIVKYFQLKYKEELEPTQKAENLVSQGTPEDQNLRMAIQFRKEWTINWWQQSKILCQRTFRERWGDYFDPVRFFQAIGVALLLGLLWWDSNGADEIHLRDQVGLLFYVCIFWTSSSLFGAVYVFPFEKIYLVKERKADMYRLNAYYVCSTLCDMIAHVLYPAIFMSILYFMVGFKSSIQSFFETLSAILLVAVTAQGAGELFGAAVMSIRRAGVIASLILMLFLLTGGYYVQHIPKFIAWLKYMSFMYYGFRLLLKVQYGGNQVYDCDSVKGCKYIQESPSFATLDLNGKMNEVWVLLGMAICYRLLAYACLRRKINNAHL